jgi:hypothetical protein
MDRSGNLIRTIILAVFFIAAIPLTVLAIIYATGIKKEIGDLKSNNDKLVREVTQQRQLINEQLKTNRTQLAVTQQQLEVSKNVLQISEDTNNKVDVSNAIQQQLLGVTQATLDQVRQINRKTPNFSSISSFRPAQTSSLLP